MAEGTARSERELKTDIDAIKNDLDTLRRDLGSVVERIKGSATDRAGAEIAALQKRLNKLASDAQATGREGLRTVEAQIEERPLLTLAIAFAAGLILGRLFDRR